MKFTVIKDFKGSPDGRYAVQYREGEEVELTASLAEVALAQGWVKEVAEEAADDKKKSGKGGAKSSARSSESDE